MEGGGNNNRNKPIKNNIIWGNSHVHFTLTATTEVHNDLSSMSEIATHGPQDSQRDSRVSSANQKQNIEFKILFTYFQILFTWQKQNNGKILTGVSCMP